MPRDVYFQSVGNPLQWRRLPQRALRIALPIKDLPWNARRGLVTNTLLVSALIVGTYVGGLAMLSGSYLFWWQTIFAATSFACFVTMTFSALRSRHSVTVVAVCATLVALSIPFGLPLQLYLTLAGLALSIYSWLFARHWIELCTTSLSRHDARSLRRSWRGYLMGVATIPFFLSVLATITGMTVVVCAIGLVALVQIVLAKRTVNKLPIRLVVGSILSWLTHGAGRVSPPGTWVSPAGPCVRRCRISISCAVFVLTAWGLELVPPDKTDQGNRLISRSIAISLATLAIPLGAGMFPTIIALPVLAEANAYRKRVAAVSRWREITSDLRESPNPIERRSLLMGRVLEDGSPVLVPREVFNEHAHFLGDSGSGKTARGLAPLIEQLGASGDSSIIVIDMKADSLELLSTLIAAAEGVRQRTGVVIPVKQLSNQDDLATYAFNPLDQPFWNQFNEYLRTDILCGATGLEYGSDYGPGYYSSANAAVMHHTIQKYPDVRTFRELAQRCGYVVANADKRELHPEIRRSGVHVHEVLKRLGEFKQLNVTDSGGYPRDVVQQAIDLTEPFRRPQFLYFHLSATLAPGTSPALARLVTYFLLAASTQTKRNCPVYLVIDEFQRMVAQNIEYMLQLARSMGVGIILANQAMQDLRTATANLIPAIETNCRYRQWFSVSGSEDRKRLAASSGETIEIFESNSVSVSSTGSTSQSTSRSKRVMTRLSENDILLASDHPDHSIIRLSRGSGYAQYGGLPFIVESPFHISREEYERRKNMGWQAGQGGTFVPSQPILREQESKPPIVVSTEVIGDKERRQNLDQLDPFATFREAARTTQKKPLRRKKGRNS